MVRRIKQSPGTDFAPNPLSKGEISPHMKKTAEQVKQVYRIHPTPVTPRPHSFEMGLDNKVTLSTGALFHNRVKGA